MTNKCSICDEDIVAEEASYHYECRLKFFKPLRKKKISVRETDNPVAKAMKDIYEYMDDNTVCQLYCQKLKTVVSGTLPPDKNKKNGRNKEKMRHYSMCHHLQYSTTDLHILQIEQNLPFSLQKVWVVNLMASMGFSSSYYESRTLELSAMVKSEPVFKRGGLFNIEFEVLRNIPNIQRGGLFNIEFEEYSVTFLTSSEVAYTTLNSKNSVTFLTSSEVAYTTLKWNSWKYHQSCQIPLYWKAREIVAAAPSDSQLFNTVVRLRGFHFSMPYLECIGYLMDRALPLSSVSSSIKIENDTVAMDPFLLFQRISIIIKMYDDLRMYFEYKLVSLPLVLFNESGMRKTKNSGIDLAKRMQSVHHLRGIHQVHKEPLSWEELLCCIGSLTDVTASNTIFSPMGTIKAIVTLLISQHNKNGIESRQATGDADLLIDMTAIDKSEPLDKYTVGVIGEDVDLAVLLLVKTPADRDIFLFKIHLNTHTEVEEEGKKCLLRWYGATTKETILNLYRNQVFVKNCLNSKQENKDDNDEKLELPPTFVEELDENIEETIEDEDEEYEPQPEPFPLNKANRFNFQIIIFTYQCMGGIGHPMKKQLRVRGLVIVVIIGYWSHGS
ncbi:hypothetical protein PR048_028355 [Dryococelus australis]|uniref:Uncharacterized protein n=1 Tax=Dryococelus australis TaxID=614101 RepID=A0ABQ9GJ27_9NEOP|nr:hypothetical protein PR048_028355 [Dryococelus australis]